MKNEDTAPTRLSDLIASRMEERGMSMNDLAKKVDITYEHIRRVVRGAGAPSKYVLQLICTELGLPLREAERLAMVDKIWGKYGKLLTEYLGKKPGLEPLERVWDQLSEEQKQGVIGMAQGWAKTNKVKKAS